MDGLPRAASGPRNDRGRGFRETWLDSKFRECYTRAVQSSEREFRFFWQDSTVFATPEKQNHGREKDSREAARRAEPKGNAKTLRQKDRIRTTLRKVRPPAGAHQRGNRRPRRTAAEGNLSGWDGGKKPTGVFLSLFFSLLKRRDADCHTSDTVTGSQ